MPPQKRPGQSRRDVIHLDRRAVLFVLLYPTPEEPAHASALLDGKRIWKRVRNAEHFKVCDKLRFEYLDI